MPEDKVQDYEVTVSSTTVQQSCNLVEDLKHLLTQDINKVLMSPQGTLTSYNKKGIKIEGNSDAELFQESLSLESNRNGCAQDIRIQRDKKQLLHSSKSPDALKEMEQVLLEETKESETDNSICKLEDDLYEYSLDSTNIGSPITEEPINEISRVQINSKSDQFSPYDKQNKIPDYIINTYASKPIFQETYSDYDLYPHNNCSESLVSNIDPISVEKNPESLTNKSSTHSPTNDEEIYSQPIEVGQIDLKDDITSRTFFSRSNSLPMKHDNFKYSYDNSNTLQNKCTNKQLENCSKGEKDQCEDNDFSKPRIPGVRYDNVGHRWVASWSSGGKQIQKYFPNKKFGNARAREMAIDARTQALQLEFSNMKKSRHAVKDPKSTPLNFKKRNFSILPEDESTQNTTTKNTEKSAKLICLESDPEPIKQQCSTESLENKMLMLIPNQALFLSIPVIIERVPIISSNSEYSNPRKTIEIVNIRDLINENGPNLTHLTPENIKSAKEFASSIYNSIFPKETV